VRGGFNVFRAARPEVTMTDTAPAAATPAVAPGHYNPITVTETVGASFLGLLALILLIAFLRAEARYRALLAERR
jgi:hypothetical protein